ncbi:trehalose repressor [Streptococcus tangpeifui]|uniref:trehalose repressor n=1 Tax=Streptococcus tangpeifui TaxID=2709400 RepID=UPI0024063CE2|nr:MULTISPECIES: trehalose repressor [unclassified Streptococcus]
MDEYNYEPNVFARLSAKNSHIIGLVVPGFNSVTTPRIVEVIVAYLKKNDYTPLMMHTDQSTDEEIKSIVRLSKMNVDGIIVLSTGITPTHEEIIKTIAQPVLFVGQSNAHLHTVINDDYAAGRAVGGLVGKSGAKAVLCLWVDPHDIAVGQVRKQGVMDGLSARGISDVEFVYTTFDYREAIESLKSSLDPKRFPDAIICATDRLAQAAYKVLPSYHITIGKDISVVGFGEYETSALLNPPLTSVKFDWYSTGIISGESILQMIQGKPVSNIQVIPFELFERASLVQKEGE